MTKRNRQRPNRPLLNVGTLVKRTALVLCLSHFYAHPIFAREARGDSAIRVAYIDPGGFMFWKAFKEFLEGVSDDLGISLNSITAVQRGDALHAVKQLAQSSEKPDYLIFYYQDKVGAEMIKVANEAGIRIFIVNTDITDGDKQSVGTPRTIYPAWIGHLFQNDAEVGYMLADKLIEKYSTLNSKGTTKNNKVVFAAISGNENSTTSVLRNKGLYKRLKQSSNVQLARLIETRWRIDEAKRASYELLKLYPEISLFWAASDALASGALEGISQHPRTLGKDILVGSIDWSTQGIRNVQEGNISVNIGGHFMHGGWALVLIHDYHHGVDFADELGTRINLPLEAIDASNVQQYTEIFEHSRWKKIDFRRFSKYYTPALKKYNFSLNKLFSEYENAEKTIK